MNNNKKQIKYALIFAFVIIFFSIIVFAYKNADNKDWSKTQSEYNVKDMENQFIQTAKDIETNIAMNIFESDIVNDEELGIKIKSINLILEGNNWKKIGIQKPNNWQGNWYLNKEGRLKFKFARKEIEPLWIDSTEIQEYIIKN